MKFKLCMVFVFACALLRSAQGILNAELVKIEDFSYNVMVTYKLDKPYYHTGSIIHKRFILTYGSYFLNVTWNADKSSVKSIRLSSVSEINVQALTNEWLPYSGADSTSHKNGIIEKVKTLYFPHKWFNSKKTYECVAILELQNDLDLSRGIQVLKLPTTNLNYMKDHEKFGVFTAFGRHLKDKSATGLRLMEVAIADCPKISLEDSDWNTFCGGSIVLDKNIENSLDQPLGGYWADQGGPLVYRKDTIIGVMGALGDGDDRLEQGHPAIYVNISHHLDFVNDVISGQPSLHITVAIPLSCTAT